MRTSGDSVGKRFVIGALSLAALSLGLLVMDAIGWSMRSGDGDLRSFQRSVGGLGGGASATPSWNLFYFDPRLQSVEDSNLWPIPGICPYSPAAASTVTAFKELQRNDLLIIKEEP